MVRGGVIIVALVALLVPASASAVPTASWHTYANAAGSRRYLLQVPDRLPRHPALVVYLHGCSQSAADVSVGTRWTAEAETEHFVVAYPEQPNGGCWNWFDSANMIRGQGEPSIIAGITQQVVDAQHVNPRRIYVLGASAGAYMADILGATYPDVYAAIGVLAGGPYGTSDTNNTGQTPDVTGTETYAQMGPRAREMPTFVFQGTADPINPFAMSVAAVQQWLGVADQADDGQLNGSVSRVPASEESHGVNTSQPPVPGSGDNCLAHQTMPCPGGLVGLQGSYPYTIQHYVDARGRALVDFMIVHGETHAYSGGDPAGSYTDPLGPNLTGAAWAFLSAHVMPAAHG
jgi:poly(hydroxyalkanoate) depolymerase family esterase